MTTNPEICFAMTEPTAHDLESPLFNAIWSAIKGWDIERLPGEGYANANGTDVMAIIDSLKEADLNPLTAYPPEPSSEYIDTTSEPSHCLHCKTILGLSYVRVLIDYKVELFCNQYCLEAENNASIASPSTSADQSTDDPTPSD